MIPFEPKKILCPVDLSPVSEAVLKWAGLFASTFQAPLEVFYADWWEPPRYFTEAQIERLSFQEQEGEKALRSELEALAKSSLGDLANYSVNVVEGHPAERILERAKMVMTGLIVMGSHGRTGMARLRLGSVAEDVVRTSRCPVMIVKPAKESGPRRRLRTFSAPSISQVPLNKVWRYLPSLPMLSAPGSGWLTPLAMKKKLDEVRQRICNWVRQEVRERCEVSEVVRRGNPAEQVLLMAQEHTADLIVMGAQHRPFLEFTTLGTTTERVMRHSLTSVMVIPATKQTGNDWRGGFYGSESMAQADCRDLCLRHRPAWLLCQCVVVCVYSFCRSEPVPVGFYQLVPDDGVPAQAWC